jgi:nucleoid-associated protein
MSTKIHQFIIHQLSQGVDQQIALVPRPQCLQPTPSIEALALQLHQTYVAKPAKGVGGFSDNDETAFKDKLQNGLDDEENFYQFSVESSQLLVKSLLEHGMTEVGFIIFSHYQYLATDYLLIALLNTKEHVSISADLELNYSQHLDLNKMQLAARIDLTQKEINYAEQRFISFIKGRIGRKVSDFFLSFLGCEELVDVKQQNKMLLDDVNNYLVEQGLEVEEKEQAREAIGQYYKQKIDAEENIELTEVVDQLQDFAEQNDFRDYVEKRESPLEESFAADPTCLKKLNKFNGQGGGVSISFDRKLLGQKIYYDNASDTLTIQGIPPNLRDQLIRS